MCLRFRLLANIETATVQEVVKFIRNTAFLYILLTVVSVIDAAFLYFESETLFILGVVGAVLYAFCSISFRLLVETPREFYCYQAMIFTFILLVEKIVSAIYSFSNASALIWSIISMLIQSSTIYILSKLRQKLVEGEVIAEPTIATPLYSGCNKNEP